MPTTYMGELQNEKQRICVLRYTNDYDMVDEFRDYLFEACAQDNDWQTKNDVPDSLIWETIYSHSDNEYNDFTNELDRYLSSGVFIMQGVCGRWNGLVDCGRFVRNYEDIRSGIEHLDYIKFYDKCGHFYIEGSHHDGSDKYELKQLTDKCIALAERNWFAHNRELHNKLMQNGSYSKPPHIARTIYGA